jgi:predicted porin
MKIIFKFYLSGLAAAAAMFSANARSQVAVYGVVDLGIEALTNVPDAATGRGRTLVREQSANAQLSRIGFKGSEAITPCLKTLFKLETAIFPDTGSLAPNGKLFHGSSYVGLSGCQGELTVGRQISLLYEQAYYFDPLSIFAYGLTSMDVVGFGGRADNSFKYRKSVGPVTMTGFYSFGYSGAFEETAGMPKIAREASASLHYDDQHIAVGLAFDRLNGTTPATQDQLTNRIFLGGSVKFGKEKIFAGIEHYRLTAIGSTQASSFDLAWTGLQHAFTPRLNSAVGVFHKQYGTGEGSALSMTAYLDYFLSRRTDLYVNVGHIKNSRSLNLGVDGQPGIIGPGTLAGHAQSGLVVGMRHTF